LAILRVFVVKKSVFGTVPLHGEIRDVFVVDSSAEFG